MTDQNDHDPGDTRPVADVTGARVLSDEEAGETPEPPRDFVGWLLDHTAGRTNDDVSHALRTVVAGVLDTEKKGSVTVTFTVEPVKGQANAVHVSDEIKTKVPERQRPTSTFFVDDNHDMTLDNPKQGMFRGMPARR